MSTYNATLRSGLDDTTPTEGATPPSEVNNAIREIKVVLKDETVFGYGAIGDGLTDDAGAFTDAASLAKTVTIPAGTYKLDSDVTTVSTDWDMHSGVTIAGTGKILGRGFWVDYGNGANIKKLRDRVFIGDAVEFDGNFDGTVNNYSPVPRWLSREAQLLVHQSKGRIAITGLSRTNLGVTTPGGTPTSVDAAMGIAGVAVNDYTGADKRNTWGGYFETWRAASVTNAAFGVEIDAGNDGADHSSTPYAPFGSGVFGLTVAAGGSKGAAYTNPSSVGIVIANNTQTFNTGILFGATAITGTDGSTGTGTAICMAKGHVVQWNASDGVGAFIYSSCATTNNRTSMVFTDNNITLYGSGTNQLFQALNVASSVNYLRAFPAIAGAAPGIQCVGTDTNIDLFLVPKGTGNVKFGTFTSNADAPIVGYISIKAANGVAVKLAVIA